MLGLRAFAEAIVIWKSTESAARLYPADGFIIDRNGIVAILPPMSSMGVSGHSRWRGISRAGWSAAFALCFVFAFASGDARALCLDFGGGCSPSAAIPLGPCHNQAPANKVNSSCNSCVDVLVPEAASASNSRPDHELRVSAAAESLAYASAALETVSDAATTGQTYPIRTSPREPFLRIAVLRI